MFSNVFKVVLSVSLLTAVSAMAADLDASSDDLGRQRSKDATHNVSEGKTFSTMEDQAKQQANQARQLDPNSIAGKAAARTALLKQGSGDGTLLKGQIKTLMSNVRLEIPDADSANQIARDIWVSGQVNPRVAQVEMTLVQRGADAIKGKNLSVEGSTIAKEIIVKEVEAAQAGADDDSIKIVNGDSAAEAIKLYVVDVEIGSDSYHKLSHDQKVAAFKAAKNFEKIVDQYKKIAKVAKADFKSKNVSLDKIDERIWVQAALDVIQSFHSTKPGEVNYMSEAEMEKLALDIVKEKKCV